jgi:hypothetical protein
VIGLGLGVCQSSVYCGLYRGWRLEAGVNYETVF